MSSIEVPGARIYYDTYGSGRLVVLIPGAAGTTYPYRLLAEQLAAHYTVVTHDRRGFSRSELVGPQDYDHRIESDAEDVRRLIEHLSDQPAIVFGSSSGAIVALETLIQGSCRSARRAGVWSELLSPRHAGSTCSARSFPLRGLTRGRPSVTLHVRRINVLVDEVNHAGQVAFFWEIFDQQ